MRAHRSVTEPPAAAPAGPAPYRLHVEGSRVVLAGSVDTATAGGLATDLAGAPVGPHPVLDLRELAFVDVAGCRALAGWASAVAARGARLEVRGASALLRRMWDVLGLASLAPVTFTAPRG